MVKTIKAAGILLLSGFLVACGAPFKSDVATFHKMASPSGESVTLTVIDADKAESLEYEQYAGVIGNELQRLGYRISSSGQSDLTVAFNVVMNDGREKLYNRPAAFAGGPWGFGWGGACFRCGGFGGPWGGFGPGFGWGGWGPGFGAQNELRAKTVYHTELHITITNARGKRVFDGRVEADIRENKLPESVPLLARALFKEFPGESGITRKIVLSPEERKSLEGIKVPASNSPRSTAEASSQAADGVAL